MAKIVLILGGVRSGKSRFAQQLAEKLGGDDVLFVATAEAGDAEMTQRIVAHRRDRPTSWRTIEAPLHVGRALQDITTSSQAVLIDCLTLLVSNVLLACQDLDAAVAEEKLQLEVDSLLRACEQRPGTVIIVSDEVGCGVVPDNRLGRMFRDLLGWTNQRVAAQAAATYLMVAGHAVEVKAIAATLDQAAHSLGTHD